jgi:UDPglucose 6-dehydrogenase
MKEAVWRLESVKDSLYFARDEYDAASGSSAITILTPWNQFRSLNLERIRQELLLPHFFDLRNIYKRKEAENAGLHYYAVGK